MRMSSSTIAGATCDLEAITPSPMDAKWHLELANPRSFCGGPTTGAALGCGKPLRLFDNRVASDRARASLTPAAGYVYHVDINA